MGHTEDSTVVAKERCPRCAAMGRDLNGDNLAVYSDGHAWCFSEGCSYYRKGDGKETPESQKVQADFVPLKTYYSELPDRRLSKKVLQMYGYGLSKTFANSGNEQVVHAASYRKDDVLVSQHVRTPDKDFYWHGAASGVELFGQHLWKAGGKTLIITEGEIDAMSVAQILDYRVPVVSIPSGAQGAVKSIKENLEFVASFSEIILMFDMDAPGRNASHKVAEILPPGRVRIAVLPYKDANEALMKDDSAAVVTARYQSAVYSPDEICHASEIISRPVSSKPTKVWSYPFDMMTDALIGRRSGEIVMWGSGTGSGKSTMMRELIYHDLLEKRKVGAIMLEESPEETIDELASIHLSKPIKKIKAFRIMNELRKQMGKPVREPDFDDSLTDKEYADTKAWLANSGLFIYDHMGNNSMQNLMARMEFMAVALEVDSIVLDHITAAATGIMAANQVTDDGSGSERLIIDQMMKDLRNLTVRTNVHLDLVSQLKKTSKAFEEGDRITLQDFRGSGALTSVPNSVIAMERNRQSSNSDARSLTEIRLLKDRLTGKSGVVALLRYNESTGRLLEEEDFGIDEEGNVILHPKFEKIQ